MSGVGVETVSMNGRLTFQLLVQLATTRDAECADELFEVDGTVLVLVKDVEDIVGELVGIAEGEELLVYPAELGLVKLTGGTVLSEALVPNRG